METLMGAAFLIGMLLVSIGGLYWLWVAIQIGSFSMFVIGVIPPLFIFTAPVGAWGLLFGMPSWVFAMFA